VTLTLFFSDYPEILRVIASVLGDEIPVQGSMNEKGRAYFSVGPPFMGLRRPEDIKPAWGQPWSFTQLPTNPRSSQIEPFPGAEHRLEVAVNAIANEEVDRVVVATEPGCEGSLFFQYIFESIPTEIEVLRLWPTSLHEADVRRALGAVLPLVAYEGLTRGWKGEQEIDWAVKHSLSRASTLAAGNLLPVGRIATPLLVLCDGLSHIEGTAMLKASFHEGNFFSAFFVDGQGARPEFSAAHIESILSDYAATPATVTCVERTEETIPPPGLFTQEELCRTANKSFGFTATQTLTTAKRLFRQGFITWPETKQNGICPERLAQLPEILMAIHVHQVEMVDLLLEEMKDNPLGQNLVSNFRIGEHEGILPTPMPVTMAQLEDDEQQIYSLVVKQFVGALLPPCIGIRTKIRLKVDDFDLLANILNIEAPGWTGFLSAEGLADDVREGFHTDIKEGAVIPPLKIEAVPGHEELPESVLMSEAAAAGLIDPVAFARALAWLGAIGFVHCRAGQVLMTAKGRQALDSFVSLARMSPSLRLLLSLAKVADWSEKVLGLYQAGQVMEAQQHVGEVLSEMARALHRAVLDDGICPKCGKALLFTLSGPFCESSELQFKGGCSFKMDRLVMGQEIPVDVAKELVLEGISTSEMEFVSQKTGKPYKARVKMDTETGRVSLFFPERVAAGMCPACGEGEVVEHDKRFSCSNWKEGCKFVVWRGLDGPNLEDVQELLSLKETSRAFTFLVNGRQLRFVLRLQGKEVIRRRA